MLIKILQKQNSEEFSVDELIEKIILIEKIETGIKQSENEQVITENQLEKEIETWFG